MSDATGPQARPFAPRRLAITCLVVAWAWIALPQAAVAAPPQCLTNLVANVFAGNPTVLPAAPCNDPDGDALTIIIVDGPSHGVVSPQATDGTRTYTADAAYVGNDVVHFKASDGTSESAVSTLTINVQAPPTTTQPPVANHAPVALADVLLLAPSVKVTTGDVRANDSDVDGDALTVVTWSRPAHGRVTCAGGVRCRYTAGSAFRGNDSFQYTISDGHGGTATTRARIRRATAKPQLRPRRPGKKGYGFNMRCDARYANCWYLLSTQKAVALNQRTPWIVEPSTKEWVDSCTQFGFLPIDPEDCAAKFASRALGNVFDKTVISHAAGIYPIPLTGDYTTRDPVCLAWRVSRKSPLYRHEPELASSWTDPNLQQDNSLVAPGSPNLRWQKGGLLHPSFWDVPLRCGKDGLVYLDSGPVVVLQG